MSTPALTALRAAMVAKVMADAMLTALVGASVFHRYKQAVPVVPSVTYFDFGTQPDATVPLLDRTFQWDVWAKTLDDAEVIADRLRVVLDGKPFTLPGQEAKPVYLGWTADRDDIEQTGEIARKTLEFRLLAYRLT